jgi:hypothetical protein
VLAARARDTELVFDVLNGTLSLVLGGEVSSAVTTLVEVNPAPGNPLTTLHVSYDGGAFVMVQPGLWMENNANGPFGWVSEGVDSDNIFLTDESRGVDARLDLSTNGFFATFPGQEEQRYFGLNAEAGPVGGWLAKQVVYASGDFTQTGGDTWVDNASDGTHNFVEYDRDENSVWLEDTERNIFIELYVTGGIIKIGPPGDTRVLYVIERSW